MRRGTLALGTPALGAATVIAGVLVTVALYAGWFEALFRDEGRTVRAEFTNVQQLQVGDQVRLEGLEDGRVTSITARGEGRSAIVEMDVSDDAGPLYRNAKAELRWKNLLGGSFYVELERGTPGAGPLTADYIGRDRTRTQVELDDVSTVFDGKVKRGTQTLVDELSRTMRDPDAIGRALDTLEEVSPNAKDGLEAVQGLPGQDALRRLVRGGEATVRALDTPDAALRTLISGAAGTLETTARRDAELRATLALGGGTADSIRTTLARLDGTLKGAEGLVEDLDAAAPDVAPTLRALRPTLTRADRLLIQARPLLRSLRPAVRSLAAASKTGTPLLTALDPSIERLEAKVLPFLAEPDPETGKSTTVMIGGTAAGFGGSAGQQDTNGHFVRFPASIGDSSVYLPCRTALTDPTQAQLVACEGIEDALQNYLKYLPSLLPQKKGSK